MKLKQFLTPALAAVLTLSAGAAFAQYGPPPQGPPQGYQQGPPQGYQGPGGWENAPPEFREWQQRGFHDGIEGAKKDFENHRPPNVLNRDEFRHPHVPGPFRRDYKDGFRRGYNVAVQHMFGGPGPYGPR